MKTEVTFILPTLNGLLWIKRAIDSCLTCESDIIVPYVIVIDGESDDGTFEKLKETYCHDPRAQLLQSKRTDGFMTTCFQGVDLVKTEFVTFMYDDDILSPYFKNMIIHMVKHKKKFIMGYGKMYNVETTYPFKPITHFKHYPNLQLLLGYFGYVGDIEYSNLPVSPICCIVKTDLLHEWMGHVTEFAQKNKVREYFMLQKNIGPDLMIYLLSILRSKEDVCVASAIVAQFSKHPNSMSIIYGNIDTAVGYWLARIWAFEYLSGMKHTREAAKCASYLIFSGAKILVNKFRGLNLRWSLSILKEIFSIGFKILGQRNCQNTLRAGYSLLKSRAQNRTLQLYPE